MDLENNNEKIVGYVNVSGHSVPIVADLRPLRWAEQQENVVVCVGCGKQVYVSYKETGVHRGIPVMESVYSRAVIEENGQYTCRCCELQWTSNPLYP